MTGEQLLTQALTHVEASSVRTWALSDHNKPILERIAQGVIDKGGIKDDTILRFATWLICEAIGL